MKAELVFIGLIVLVLLAVACVLVGGTVPQQLQRDATLLEQVQPYLKGCEIGTVRHLVGVKGTNHEVFQIWACEVGSDLVMTSQTICVSGQCSRTLVITTEANWRRVDKLVSDGEYSEVK